MGSNPCAINFSSKFCFLVVFFVFINKECSNDLEGERRQGKFAPNYSFMYDQSYFYQFASFWSIGLIFQV
jgi:hypothetical protein